MPIPHRTLTFCALALCSQLTFGSGRMAPDSVRIFGSAPEYAGMSLVFERTSNFICRDKEEVVRIAVDAKGNFDQCFSASKTLFCATELGAYDASMYVEPGKAYNIELPPLTPRPLSEKFNPYFTPEQVELGIINEENALINKSIRDFDEAFDSLYNTNAILVFAMRDVAKAKLLISKIDSVYPSSGSLYFDSHKKARYAQLYHLAYKRQKRTAIAYFTNNLPIDFDMPAYTEAFNEMFKDFFLYYFSTPAGRGLRDAFTQKKGFVTLSAALAADTLFSNPEFRETVLLKSLYDAYYSERYDQSQIENLVKEAIGGGATTSVKFFASSMLIRFNKLKSGTLAPDFTAFSASGKVYTLGSYKGKFLYLNFAHTQNYACKKDLLTLAALAHEYKKDLQVVTIFTDDDPNVAFTYGKQNELKYDLLHIRGNGKILLDYNVKAMPAYFLVDPEGNIAINAAPSPGDGFSKIFEETVNSFKHSKARKSPDYHKTIYDF